MAKIAKKQAVTKKKVTKKTTKKKVVKKKTKQATIKSMAQKKIGEMVNRLDAIAQKCISEMKDIALECGINLEIEVLIKDMDTVK